MPLYSTWKRIGIFGLPLAAEPDHSGTATSRITRMSSPTHASDDAGRQLATLAGDRDRADEPETENRQGPHLGARGDGPPGRLRLLGTAQPLLIGVGGGNLVVPVLRCGALLLTRVRPPWLDRIYLMTPVPRARESKSILI